MRVRFWLYVVAYSALSAGGVYDSISSNRAVLPVALELASAVLGLAGMLLYFFRRVGRQLSKFWKFVFALLVSESIVSSWFDLAHIARDPEMGPSFALAIALAVTAFLIPSFWMNWKVASSHRAGAS